MFQDDLAPQMQGASNIAQQDGGVAAALAVIAQPLLLCCQIPLILPFGPLPQPNLIFERSG
ncbi:MAG: hypothetical protein AAFQ58_00645 [Pseudomonadota bacterium]